MKQQVVLHLILELSTDWIFKILVIAMSMTNFGGDLRFDGSDLDIEYER